MDGPKYNDWPLLDDALLASIRAELTQNLSSVLNTPDAALSALEPAPKDTEAEEEAV